MAHPLAAASRTMSTNSNHKAVSPKQGEVASGAGFEDDWVEAEIERLLQSVHIEEESGVGGHNLLQDQYGTVCAI